MACGILMTLYTVVGKISVQLDHPVVVCTWISVGNTILSVICTGIFESFIFPSDTFCRIALLMHATCTGAMTVLIPLAFQHVQSTDVSVFSSLTVALVFVFQFSFLQNSSPSYSPVNTLSISSAITVSLLCFLMPTIECIKVHWHD